MIGPGKALYHMTYINDLEKLNKEYGKAFLTLSKVFDKEKALPKNFVDHYKSDKTEDLKKESSEKTEDSETTESSGSG